MLILKLAVVPCFLALLSYVGRRWGAGIAGLLAGFPVVTGPILVFLTVEQGPLFAAQAALGAMSAVVACIAFGALYAWASRRWRWPAALALGYLGWFGVAWAFSAHELPSWLTIGLTLLSIAAGRRCLPSTPTPLPAAAASPGWELGLRMLAGAALVTAVTLAAQRLGVRWSGLFAMFPVLGTVLGVFTHLRSGAAQVAALFRGMFLGFVAFAVFCAVVEQTLRHWPPLPAFLGAMTAAMLVQLFAYRYARTATQHRAGPLPARHEAQAPAGH